MANMEQGRSAARDEMMKKGKIARILSADLPELARMEAAEKEKEKMEAFLALSPAEQRQIQAQEKAKAEAIAEQRRLARESDPEVMKYRAEEAKQLAEMAANEAAYQNQLKQERAKAEAIAEQSALASEPLTPQEKALAKARELAAKDPRAAKLLAEAEAKRRAA